MTKQEIFQLITDSSFANLGFLDFEQKPSIRRVFCTWHKGLGAHLISTNTSSQHVQNLLKNDAACLYFENSSTFSGVCLSGKAVLHLDCAYKEMLWHEQDIKYYSKGINDPDYCIIEFLAETGRYYRFDGKGNLSPQEIEAFDKNRCYTDYASAH